MVNKFDVDVLCKGFCVEEMQEGWTKGAGVRDLKRTRFLARDKHK
jgi:hypothetical protein